MVTLSQSTAPPLNTALCHYKASENNAISRQSGKARNTQSWVPHMSPQNLTEETRSKLGQRLMFKPPERAKYGGRWHKQANEGQITCGEGSCS